MPRKARHLVGGVCYHVINRGNQRGRIFHCDDDYRYFVFAMLKAQGHRAMELFAACLMPNHIHLVVRPRGDHDLGRWMQCLMTTHVRWHHGRYQTSGRLWQGRYKAFPIELDSHLLTVLRYVERNPLRAQLVHRAEQWPWGSLAWRTGELRRLIADPPVPRPRRWIDLVNAPQTPEELEAIRVCVNGQRPFGSADWVDSTGRQLGLTATSARRGRPSTNARDKSESLELSTERGRSVVDD